MTTVGVSQPINIVDALIETKLASSKREAREFIKNGAIAINGEKISDEAFILTSANAIDGVYSVLKRGKKLYALLQHQA